MNRSIDALLKQAYDIILSKEKVYSSRIIKELNIALTKVLGEMGRVYEKYAVNGKLTKAALIKYGRFATIERQLIDIMNNAVKNTKGTIEITFPEVYKEAYSSTAWAFDMAVGTNLAWGILNKNAIVNLYSIANPKNLEYSIALENYSINARKAIRSALINGLSQGKYYTQMARDLKGAIDITKNSALRIVRTEGQGALNSGSNDAYKKAEYNGVSGKYVWDATLDGRTRPATKWAKGNHREMDGQVRGENGLFKLNFTGETAPYPGYEGLSPGQRCNCRCVLSFEIEGFSPKLRRAREQGIIPYMTYAEWEKKYGVTVE